MSGMTPTNWTRRDDAMVEDAIRRGASRRELLKLLMASGVAMGAGGSLLLGASKAMAQTPVSGGHLRGAGWSSSTADTLDPAVASLSTDYVRCCAFYNRLTFLDEGSKLRMELAESIESDDAQTWQVRLRPDVAFHDGKTLTAADVVYSMNRHKDPAVGSKAAAIAEQMTEITAVDDRTVRFALAAPNADLPVILALHHFMILADGTTDFGTANGTGAFICEEFEPGVRSIGRRNPNYFKDQLPYLESFEYFAISDNNARVNALLSGDIHVAASINPRSMRLLEGQNHVETSVTTAGNYTNLNIRLDLSPGDREGFVEGMKYLMNREVIVNSVLRGLGQLGNDQPVSPMDRYHNPNLPPREYDPERASAAFDRAGLLGQEIEIITSDAPNSGVDYAMVVQQAGTEAGMNFRVQRVPADGYWSNYWLQSPIHFGNINPRPTPDILFSLLYASDAPWNESQYKSEKFDSMLVEARGMLDDERRKEIYWEMQEMIANEAGTIIPAYISNVDAISSKLKGLRPNPLGGQFGYAFAEYVWLEE
ncbi:MAG: ABC transporter substrate-binding protein [Paracoccus sp. (in: a-proteobacteria)]